MKNFLAIFTLCFIGLGVFAQPYTWTATINGGGIWESPLSWTNLDGAPYPYPQTNNDIVIIKDLPLPFLLNSSVIVKSITIDNSFMPTQLIINDGFSITTSDDIILQGALSGNSLIALGIGSSLYVGDGTEDGITIDGSIGISGNNTINTSGYFNHNSGQISLTGDLEINISTAGAIPASTDKYNYFVGSGASYTIATGTINFTIDVANGNLGTKEEIYFENALITNTRTGGETILNIENSDGSDNSFTMLTDMNLGKVNVNVGAGNKLLFDNLADPPTVDVFFKELNVISGEFEMASGSLLTVDPASSGL